MQIKLTPPVICMEILFRNCYNFPLRFTTAGNKCNIFYELIMQYAFTTSVNVDAMACEEKGVKRG